MTKVEEWLVREDEVCHSDRVKRLEWLASILPEREYLTFPGGLMAKFLFEEARYCFAYGQYLAVIVLGMAFIERTLAAEFYASGRNDLERATFIELLCEAQKIGWLTAIEYKAFDRARKIRNPVTHFRHPGHRENIQYRAVDESNYPYAVIEQDARIIAASVMHMVAKHAV